MATVQKLNHAMLEDYLKASNYKYLRDSDGDFRVDFSYDEAIDCKLSHYLILEGEQHDIYTLRIHSDKRIARNDWPRFLYLVNEWNKTKRWPKAYLYIRDSQTSPSGEIILEGQLLFRQGIHQEFLSEYTDYITIGAYAFWKWIVELQTGGAEA